MIPPCSTLSKIIYVSRVKWSDPVKGVASSPSPRCSRYWKGSLLVPLDYGHQLTNTYSIHSVIWYQILLYDTNYFSNISTRPIHGTLTGTTTLVLSEPVSKGNETVALNCKDLQNWMHFLGFNPFEGDAVGVF